MRNALLGTTAAALAAGTGAFTLDAATAETADPQETAALAVPEPGGEYATGTTQFRLVDEDRADVWVPEEDRELMVTMWYPTGQTEGATAPYMTPEEGALFGAQLQLPGELLASVETNSVTGAEPLADAGDLPLVVLSPGFSFPRATLTGLGEELASRGYAVAAVGHNYEAPITFPDGRTTECLTCTQEDLDTETLVPNRSEDLSFVVDRLTGDDTPAPEGLGVDEDRIAVGGHSIGGAGSHRVMADDDRFDAGFNLDGTFFALDPHKLDRPFMMVGAEVHGQPGDDKTWSKAWKRLDDWKRWITVDGTTHSSMTDFGPLGEQAGLNQDELDGFRSNEISRSLVTAFVDQHLRGDREPILCGPSDAWPELQFHNP
ncbi:Platelet-activating factor acetylhydrolase, isoform II [Glycomyces harbinensis]|uniref:Platelet-activating factor acetylhydrolase, isoform II n=2 Tax=Glycomyces harbinensis TaxID=58114 RepID=A0A1G7D1G7_9ACTN|nr:Platelet-activating factor acetylhydrolase, isoform II [Glycomyces harbinensis]